MKPFKPMLATAAQISRLRFPLYASPKLDGIRAVVREGSVVSRNLKPIPNAQVQAAFGLHGLTGLDGELIVGPSTAPDVFRATSSGVMSSHGSPDVVFHVFDCVRDPCAPFVERQAHAEELVAGFGGVLDDQPRIVIVEQRLVLSLAELLAMEEDFLNDGYEGLMLRDGGAPYKYGRGTVTAQDLLKLKRFEDAEAVIIGFDELLHNSNEATINDVGIRSRSTAKAGLVGRETLGALRVRGITGHFAGCEFNVGTGLDAATRELIWTMREDWLGRVIKYKYFPIGSKGAPRFPVFLGERSTSDM